MPMRVVEREATHLYADAPNADAHSALIASLLKLQQIENAAVDRVRRTTGLSRSEFHALRYLLQAQRDDRPTGPKDLRTMLGLSNPAVTKVIDGLERAGLLVRKRHPTDRRAQLLEPTIRGAHVIAAGYRGFHAALVDAVDRQPAEAARISAALLNDIAMRLSERADDAADERASVPLNH
jgi:DNA-binding MarR family transcriptional regulator